MKLKSEFIKGKRSALALAQKEFISYLNTPSFFGATVFFLIFCAIGLFYFQDFIRMNTASMRPYFSVFPLVFILVIPVLTMKSWAEERKTGSVELLLTMPLSEWDLVLGKFLAVLSLLLVMLVFTIPLPITLSPLGDFDIGVILCEYIGALLMGSSAIALGLLLSSLSKNQAGSFVGCAVVLMITMLADQLAFALNLPMWLTRGVNAISLAFHFESFTKGLLDSRNVIYYLASTYLFLFLTTRVLIFRKWR